MTFIDYGLAIDIWHSVLYPEYLEVADMRIYFAYFKGRTFSICLKAQNHTSKQLVIKKKQPYCTVKMTLRSTNEEYIIMESN